MIEIQQFCEDIKLLMVQVFDVGDVVFVENVMFYVIFGECNLFDVEELFLNMKWFCELFDFFEQCISLMCLFDVFNWVEGVQIFIGGELGIVLFDECSVIIVFYIVDGWIVGLVGVIGLIWMVYEWVILIVDIIVWLLFSVFFYKDE